MIYVHNYVAESVERACLADDRWYKAYHPDGELKITKVEFVCAITSLPEGWATNDV